MTMAGNNEPRILTCVYCGHEYPQDTPTWGNAVLTAHIKKCEKHPMYVVMKENDRLHAELCRIRSTPSFQPGQQTVDLEPIKARLGAVSPRPWKAQEQDLGSNRVTVEGPIRRDKHRGYTLVDIITDGSSIADAEFIEHAPEDIEALIAEVEWLRERDAQSQSDLVREIMAVLESEQKP